MRHAATLPGGDKIYKIYNSYKSYKNYTAYKGIGGDELFGAGGGYISKRFYLLTNQSEVGQSAI